MVTGGASGLAQGGLRTYRDLAVVLTMVETEGLAAGT